MTNKFSLLAIVACILLFANTASAAVIEGYKFFDRNGNKTQDPGDPGLKDWTINLSGPVNNATVTDVNGFYSFTDLPAGSYLVEESFVGKPAWKPITSPVVSVNLTAGETRQVNFGNGFSGSHFLISGFKINDTNGNGVWDAGEVGIAGWNITLKDNTTGTVLDTTFTNATGYYEFLAVGIGDYNVTEETRAGWNNTNATFKYITILNQDVTNQNFTNRFLFITFKLSGYKINDTNRNGVWDAGEKGIGSWNITLKNATTDVIIGSTLTDSTGFYQFLNLAPGQYNVTEEIRAAWKPTNATFKVVTLVDRDLTNLNFTNDLLMISGYKINDTNGNGKWDAGEAGIGGWNITLLNGSTGTFIASTMTNSSGYYEFRELFLGSYNVTEEDKAGWVHTNATFKNVTLAVSDITNLNFTNRQITTCVICGQKVYDRNGNGKRDAGEETLANWTIKLSGYDTSTRTFVSRTTVTDFNGSYGFANLTPGIYIVQEILNDKPAWKPTAPTIRVVHLKGNETFEVNFFNRLSPSHTVLPGNNSTINGYKFNDTNRNGIRDAGEDGIANWTIRLLGFDTSTRTVVNRATTTNATGYFEFSDVTPGSYMLSEVQKPGWLPTTPGIRRVTVPPNATVNFGNRRI